MSKRRTSLSGAWSGAFRYPGDVYPETVFNAQIEESGATFFGQTQQPNVTHPHLGPTVFTAEIQGARTGLHLTFDKFYDTSTPDQYGAFTVRYEGQVDENLTRIEGVWTNGWSGTFFMTRDDDGAAEEAEERAEITIGRDNQAGR